MIGMLTGMTAGLTGLGLTQALIASRLVTRFAARQSSPPAERPPVTVLKPLCGDEPLLETALATMCRQAYPEFQIVCGVQDAADPAVAVVERLRQRFPDTDITLRVDAARHGTNGKISNLINMAPAARHDILVIADSDMHVRLDYLDRLMAALHLPDVGLVTTVYAGLPAVAALPATLGAMQITYGFLPAALLSRALGRQDCLGATMCLRRRDLQRIGGLHALADHLADDNMLGRRIAALGLRVALADTVPLTTVPEASPRALFRHELRWTRTIRSLAPAAFALSVLQYPLAWGLLTILLSGGALWSVGLYGLAWLLRASAARGVDRALAPLWKGTAGNALHCPVWLLPLRDILSVAVMLASYGGRRVQWRGHHLDADTPPPLIAPVLPRWPVKENQDDEDPVPASPLV